MSTRILNSQAGSSRRYFMTRTISPSSTSRVSSPTATLCARTAPGSAALNFWPNAERSVISPLDRPGAADFPLQKHDAVHERFSGGRTAWHVDINGNDPIAAAHDGIGVVIVAAAIGAGPHRDHITRLGHLVVNLAQRRGHLVGQRSCKVYDQMPEP